MAASRRSLRSSDLRCNAVRRRATIVTAQCAVLRKRMAARRGEEKPRR